MNDNDRKEVAKILAERFRKIASGIETKGLPDPLGAYSESLAETLESILEDKFMASVLVTATEDACYAEWSTHQPVPGALFEMVGRMRAAADQLSMMATHIEMHEDDEDEDHTGHGCAFDPEVKAKNAN